MFQGGVAVLVRGLLCDTSPLRDEARGDPEGSLRLTINRLDIRYAIILCLCAWFDSAGFVWKTNAKRGAPLSRDKNGLTPPDKCFEI